MCVRIVYGCLGKVVPVSCKAVVVLVVALLAVMSRLGRIRRGTHRVERAVLLYLRRVAGKPIPAIGHGYGVVLHLQGIVRAVQGLDVEVAGRQRDIHAERVAVLQFMCPCPDTPVASVVARYHYVVCYVVHGQQQECLVLRRGRMQGQRRGAYRQRQLPRQCHAA